jgi:tripartite-type tricarboxylate transporter receptor subunit TctC
LKEPTFEGAAILETVLRPCSSSTLAKLSSALTLALLLPLSSYAQNWPDKPIHLVVAFAAGGLADTIARTLQPKLSESFGQPVLIENKGGAGGSLAEAYLAKSAPDGYTMMMGVDSLPVNPLMIKGLSYDTFKDLQPVSLLARVPLVLITPSTSQVNNLPDLIKAARAQPGRLSYASPGSGTSNHLYMELLNTKSGNEMIHIPYKGGGPAITDLMGGQVDAMLISVTLAAPQWKAGKLKALAVTGETRSVLLGDVKTFPELGYPEMVTYTWGGLFLPAGTPPAISQRIFNDFSKIIHQPEIVARFRDLGAEVVMNTPSEFTALLQSTRDKMAELIASKKISF